MTGATGFIGSHLTRWLVRQGHHVICLVREGSQTERLSRLDVELIQGDILEKSSLTAALRRGVDTVFHLAAISYTKAGIPLEDYLKVNVEGTMNVSSAALEGQIERFIYLSSIEAMGLHNSFTRAHPANENTVCMPNTYYGLSKLKAEQSLLDLHIRHGFPAIIIRPTVVFGPDDTFNHGALKLIRAIKKGIFRMVGSGRNLVSWCYVENLVSGLLLAAEYGKAGQTYLMNDLEPYPMGLVANKIADELGVEIAHRTIPISIAKLSAIPIEAVARILGIDPPLSRSKIKLLADDYVFDISKASRELGYRQVFSLDEGIRRTIEWCLTSGILR